MRVCLREREREGQRAFLVAFCGCVEGVLERSTLRFYLQVSILSSWIEMWSTCVEGVIGISCWGDIVTCFVGGVLVKY